MNNVKKLTLIGSDIPEILRNIPDPPEVLYVLGNLQPLLKLPRLAVVGSRKVTPYGKLVTEQLAKEVAGKGVVIVSGLAFGVDAVAHQAALDVNGYTVAVLGSSLDQIAPVANQQLAQHILDRGGAIISEYSEGSATQATNYIARNRIVSGLSDGVLITEAALKSGTMHTANFALGQGKVVMAVPGNINSPFSEGTNNLIKTGAIPITSGSDVFLALGFKETRATQERLFGNNESETMLLALLQSGVTDAAELLEQSKLDASTFNQTLTALEISGKIYSLGAGHWSLK